jgi:hypothetical protein
MFRISINFEKFAKKVVYSNIQNKTSKYIFGNHQKIKVVFYIFAFCQLRNSYLIDISCVQDQFLVLFSSKSFQKIKIKPEK